MVFYRKYRPQKIEDLDSENVRDTLFSVLSKPDSSHAFLFTGPKGLGKTSTARIVAKAINCERPASSKLASGSKENKLNAKRYQLDAKAIEPCGKCSQCISITNGTNLDVLEIDAASNRGIDEIRDLREKIRLAPVLARKKVYIIDEVHMLTTEAFNALLKTLEEPPEHAVFILCTTEPHKVPDTIVSRCLYIPFKIATREELARSINRIAKEEKLDLSDDAVDLIASLSSGSFRDGVKILEEISLAASGKKITKELVEEKYQISNVRNQTFEIIKLLETKDVKKTLELVSELVKQGVDAKFFIEKIIEELHSQILKTVGINIGSDIQSKLTIEELKSLIELLTKAYREIRFAVLPQLPLELAVIEWQTLKNADQNAEKDAEKKEDAQRESAFRPAPISDKKKIEQNNLKEDDDVWKRLIDKVKIHNHSLAGILRGCSLNSFSKEKVVIGTSFKFHKERLEDRKSREVLENVFHEMMGSKVNIEILLKKI